MAKGDEKRAQKMIDSQSEKLNARNDLLFRYNYGQYQTPLKGAQPSSGIGPSGDENVGPARPGGPTGQGPAVPSGEGRTGPPRPGGGQQQPGQPGTPSGKPMTDAEAQAFFDKLFPGDTVSPEDLEAHRAELEAAGFKLHPNASGRITDMSLPSGNTVDPIYGAGGGINKKQWIVGPPVGQGGAPGGSFTGAYGNYGDALLSPALGGYRNFAETGGFSPQDITNIRARSIAPIRGMYQAGMDEVERGKNLAGGYMPNYAPAMAKMQREMSNRIGEQALNTEAELAGQIRQGRLAGLGGLGQLGSDINRQGLMAGGLASDTSNQMIRNQIAKSGVKGNFQEALGNIGGTIDVIKKPFEWD